MRLRERACARARSHVRIHMPRAVTRAQRQMRSSAVWTWPSEIARQKSLPSEECRSAHLCTRGIPAASCQRVALHCNVSYWPAMQLACLDLPPRALVADAHTHHPLQHQSIADSAVGGRGCSHALLRHASPHSFATGRFPTHSTVSVSSCTRTALHRTAPHCRAGTTPCAVGWCGGPRRLRVSGEPRVTCRVVCCHVACCMLAPRTLHSRAE